MKLKRRQWTIILLVVAVVVAISGMYFTREPRYKGKPFSHWLENARAADGEGWLAVRHFGTNGVPLLLRRLEYKPARWKVTFEEFRQKRSWLWLPRFNTDDERVGQAMRGFWILGADAESALPRLVELAQSGDSILSARAWGVMSFMEGKAIPAVVALSGDTNAPPRARFSAMEYLQRWPPNGNVISPATNYEPMVVSVLVRNLGENDGQIVLQSLETLISLKPESLKNEHEALLAAHRKMLETATNAAWESYWRLTIDDLRNDVGKGRQSK